MYHVVSKDFQITNSLTTWPNLKNMGQLQKTQLEKGLLKSIGIVSWSSQILMEETELKCTFKEEWSLARGREWSPNKNEKQKKRSEKKLESVLHVEENQPKMDLDWKS